MEARPHLQNTPSASIANNAVGGTAIPSRVFVCEIEQQGVAGSNAGAQAATGEVAAGKVSGSVSSRRKPGGSLLSRAAVAVGSIAAKARATVRQAAASGAVATRRAVVAVVRLIDNWKSKAVIRITGSASIRSEVGISAARSANVEGRCMVQVTKLVDLISPSNESRSVVIVAPLASARRFRGLAAGIAVASCSLALARTAEVEPGGQSAMLCTLHAFMPMRAMTAGSSSVSGGAISTHRVFAQTSAGSGSASCAIVSTRRISAHGAAGCGTVTAVAKEWIKVAPMIAGRAGGIAALGSACRMGTESDGRGTMAVSVLLHRDLIARADGALVFLVNPVAVCRATTEAQGCSFVTAATRIAAVLQVASTGLCESNASLVSRSVITPFGINARASMEVQRTQIRATIGQMYAAGTSRQEVILHGDWAIAGSGAGSTSANCTLRRIRQIALCIEGDSVAGVVLPNFVRVVGSTAGHVSVLLNINAVIRVQAASSGSVAVNIGPITSHSEISARPIGGASMACSVASSRLLATTAGGGGLMRAVAATGVHLHDSISGGAAMACSVACRRGIVVGIGGFSSAEIIAQTGDVSVSFVSHGFASTTADCRTAASLGVVISCGITLETKLRSAVRIGGATEGHCSFSCAIVARRDLYEWQYNDPISLVDSAGNTLVDSNGNELATVNGAYFGPVRISGLSAQSAGPLLAQRRLTVGASGLGFIGCPLEVSAQLEQITIEGACAVVGGIGSDLPIALDIHGGGSVEIAIVANLDISVGPVGICDSDGNEFVDADGNLIFSFSNGARGTSEMEIDFRSPDLLRITATGIGTVGITQLVVHHFIAPATVCAGVVIVSGVSAELKPAVAFGGSSAMSVACVARSCIVLAVSGASVPIIRLTGDVRISVAALGRAQVSGGTASVLIVVASSAGAGAMSCSLASAVPITATSSGMAMIACSHPVALCRITPSVSGSSVIPTYWLSRKTTLGQTTYISGSSVIPIFGLARKTRLGPITSFGAANVLAFTSVSVPVTAAVSGAGSATLSLAAQRVITALSAILADADGNMFVDADGNLIYGLADGIDNAASVTVYPAGSVLAQAIIPGTSSAVCSATCEAKILPFSATGSTSITLSAAGSIRCSGSILSASVVASNVVISAKISAAISGGAVVAVTLRDQAAINQFSVQGAAMITVSAIAGCRTGSVLLVGAAGLTANTSSALKVLASIIAGSTVTASPRVGVPISLAPVCAGVVNAAIVGSAASGNVNVTGTSAVSVAIACACKIKPVLSGVAGVVITARASSVLTASCFGHVTPNCATVVQAQIKNVAIAPVASVSVKLWVSRKIHTQIATSSTVAGNTVSNLATSLVSSCSSTCTVTIRNKKDLIVMDVLLGNSSGDTYIDSYGNGILGVNYGVYGTSLVSASIFVGICVQANVGTVSTCAASIRDEAKISQFSINAVANLGTNIVSLVRIASVQIPCAAVVSLPLSARTPISLSVLCGSTASVTSAGLVRVAPTPVCAAVVSLTVVGSAVSKNVNTGGVCTCGINIACACKIHPVLSGAAGTSCKLISSRRISIAFSGTAGASCATVAQNQVKGVVMAPKAQVAVNLASRRRPVVQVIGTAATAANTASSVPITFASSCRASLSLTVAGLIRVTAATAGGNMCACNTVATVRINAASSGRGSAAIATAIRAKISVAASGVAVASVSSMSINARISAFSVHGSSSVASGTSIAAKITSISIPGAASVTATIGAIAKITAASACVAVVSTSVSVEDIAVLGDSSGNTFVDADGNSLMA